MSDLEGEGCCTNFRIDHFLESLWNNIQVLLLGLLTPFLGKKEKTWVLRVPTTRRLDESGWSPNPGKVWIQLKVVMLV